ncbi:hypothetical protein [Teredinibacter haidensis]|uniref:hypothetical protein n=1 Tax=Teredinibacter haidensis TaxID=2731755 RepID=UPI000948A34F|nr:hypothetical protein [Teredinibacter haidensis]
MKSKLEIYSLSVCFATVLCLVIASGFGGYALLGIFVPDLTMNPYNYGQYQSNNAYWKRNYLSYTTGEKEVTKPSEEEITNLRAEGYKVALENEKREGLQTLLKSLIFAIVGGVALAIHWVLAKKSRD